MQVCSAGQITEASKVLEIRMSTTAIAHVGAAVDVDGRVAGADAEARACRPRWPAATAFGPPVVQMKSTPGWWKRYWETSSVGSGITWSASGGSPGGLAGLLEDLDRAARAPRGARAEGRKIIALRVLAATIALNSTVEVGLVIGVSASTTPIGSAT